MSDEHPAQARIRQFVEHLAGRGGFERYWVAAHGLSFNAAEKGTILRWCRPEGPHQVAFDAGCGEGRLTLALARQYARVYAADYAGPSCALLQAQLQAQGMANVTVWHHDLGQPCPVQGVDLVVLAQVLQHFPSAADRLRVLQHLHGTLRPGGRLVVTVFNYSRLGTRWRQGAPDVAKTTGYAYYHYFRVHELRALLAKAGFTRIRIRGCLNVPARLHEWARGDWLARLDAAVSRSALSRYLGIYLLAAARAVPGPQAA